MKKLLTLIVCLASITAGAQPSGGLERPITLSESLELALANSAQVKKAGLDRQILEAKLDEARAGILPRVNAGVQLDYFPWLQDERPPGAALGFAPGGPFVALPWGQPWQATALVSVEQPLYNEALRRGKPAADASRALYALLATRAEEDVIYQTAAVFYQTLQTEQLLNTVDANLDKLARLQRMAELQVANDYGVSLDVKRLRVARVNLENQRFQLLTGIEALRQTLRFLCGLPDDAGIRPKADAPSADTVGLALPTLETENTSESRLLAGQMTLNRVQANSLRAESWPRLSAYATAAAQVFRPDADVFDRQEQWFGAAAAGLRLQVPLLEGFRTRPKARLLDLEYQKLEADRDLLQRAKALEYRQARDQLLAARRGLQSQRENVELAREIVEKLGLQFREGAQSVVDLLNAQTALVEAETNFNQQVFTCRLAELKLLKAAGKLDELRRGTGDGGR